MVASTLNADQESEEATTNDSSTLSAAETVTTKPDSAVQEVQAAVTPSAQTNSLAPSPDDASSCTTASSSVSSPPPSIVGTGMLADLVADSKTSPGCATSVAPSAVGTKNGEKDTAGRADTQQLRSPSKNASPNTTAKGKHLGRRDSAELSKTLRTPHFELSTISGEKACYSLVVMLTACESIQLPGFGGKVFADKYIFKAPDKYLDLEVTWPSTVDPANAVCKFIKKKRQLRITVPLANTSG